MRDEKELEVATPGGAKNKGEKPRAAFVRPPSRPQPAAHVRGAGNRNKGGFRCSGCACLLLRAVPAGLRSDVARPAMLRGRRAPTQLCCAVVCSCALLCCAVCTCAVFKVNRVPYTTPSVSTRSASSARCALRCVPCSTVSTVGLPPRCSWHQEMPCLITWCATAPSRAAEGLDGRSTGGTQTPTMR